MEINYNGYIYEFDNLDNLYDKELSVSSWFYIKNKNVKNIEQLMILRQNIKCLHNAYEDKELLNLINELEKNIK